MNQYWRLIVLGLMTSDEIKIPGQLPNHVGSSAFCLAGIGGARRPPRTVHRGGWAKVRIARYRAACLMMMTQGSLDGYVASQEDDAELGNTADQLWIINIGEA